MADLTLLSRHIIHLFLLPAHLANVAGQRGVTHRLHLLEISEALLRLIELILEVLQDRPLDQILDDLETLIDIALERAKLALGIVLLLEIILVVQRRHHEQVVCLALPLLALADTAEGFLVEIDHAQILRH